MTSPIPPSVSERETIISRLALPSVRIFVATVILVTGAGVSAVFWKMPTNNALHDLCHEGVIDKELRAVPLPHETIAAISPAEMQQMSLPTLNMAPVADGGAEKYAQVYPAPASLAMTHAELGKNIPEEQEASPAPTIPQKFEPMRQIIDEKPVSVEPVNRDFPPMPASVSITEKSDELLTSFHFVENSRAALDKPAEQPADPFPITVVSELQPLQPLQLSGLAPLLPLQEIDL